MNDTPVPPDGPGAPGTSSSSTQAPPWSQAGPHQTGPSYTGPSQSGPPPRARSGSESFFDGIRATGLVRSDERWIGGVAGGLALRLGIDPLIVRGLLVVSVVFGGLGLLLYGLAWVLLPEQVDGRIHVQQLFRGDFDVAVLAGFALFVTGLSFSDRWSPAVWWGPDSGWWRGLLWVSAVIVVVVLIANAAGRSTTGGAGRGGRPSTGPTTSMPRQAPPAPSAAAWSATSPAAGGHMSTTAAAGTGPATPDDTPSREGRTMNAPGADTTATSRIGTTPAGQHPTADHPTGQYPTGGPYPTGQYATAQYPTAQYPTAQYPPPPRPTGTAPRATAYGTGPGHAGPGQPVGGYPPAGPPPRPTGPTTSLPRPQRKGPGAGALGIVVALGLLTFAVLLYAERIGEFDGPVLLTAGAITVVLAGLGVLVAGLRGRSSGGLGALAVVGILVLAPLSAVESAGWGDAWEDGWDDGSSSGTAIGDITRTPTDVATAEEGYSIGLGEARIDLTQVPLGGDVVDVPIRAGAGEVTVVVPEGTAFTGVVELGAGELRWPDAGPTDTSGGTQLRDTYQSPAVQDGAEPELRLDIQVGAGSVRVVEES